MKMIIRGAIALAMILVSGQLMYGQDLSMYRNFSFGMSTTNVSKLAEEKLTEVAVIHQRPALIQELKWYPPQAFEPSLLAEPAEKVLFSFYNGELYRMLVTYDTVATKGLTSEDMIQILSAKYGIATRPNVVVHFPTNEAYQATEKVIARWEDSQYSLNLFRSTLSDSFAIVMYAKQLDGQAAVAIAESVKLEQQEAPEKEAARVKQVADDLEVERQKNIKVFHP
jgi:hypothetical protein